MFNMKGFDKKDMRILLELDRDARQSYGIIAKKVGLAKSSVMNRVKKLEEQKVITDYITVIDNMRLGYVNYVVYFKYSFTTPEKEKEIIDYLNSHRKVWGLISTTGFAELVAVIATKTTQEYYKVWDEIYQKIKPFVRVIRTAILVEYVNFTRTYLLPSENIKRAEIFTGSIGSEKVDYSDNILLKELSKNGKATILELANKTNLTSAAVIYRIRNLEKREIIQGYRAKIDFRKLGLEYYKIMVSTKDLTTKKSLYSWIKSNKNVVYFDGFIGGHDFEFDIEIEGFGEFLKFLGEMKRLFGESIEEIFTFTAVNFHKETYYPEE